MKNFLFLILIVSFAISCSTQSPEDDLAKRISESKNYKALFQILKDNAAILKESKKDTALIKNYSHLSPQAKKDSLTKLYLKNDTLMAMAFKMREINQNIEKEFPELRNISIEQRKNVFKRVGEFSKIKFKDFIKDSTNF
jgi:hypothetical protein